MSSNRESTQDSNSVLRCYQLETMQRSKGESLSVTTHVTYHTALDTSATIPWLN